MSLTGPKVWVPVNYSTKKGGKLPLSPKFIEDKLREDAKQMKWSMFTRL